MLVWFQLECRYYHHYHNPVLTVPNTSKPDGIPLILESVNGGVFCKECGVFILLQPALYFYRKTLLLQTAFTFYFLILGSHQQIYQIWALGGENCQRKFPWFRWGQEESLHNLHTTGSEVRGNLSVLLALIDLYLGKYIWQTTRQKVTGWER